MRRVIYILSEYKQLFALCVALFFALNLYLMGDGQKEHFARSVTTSIFNTGRFTFSWAIYLTDLWRENKRLRQENLEYAYKIQSNQLAMSENQHLREMLGFREKYPYPTIPALVIGQDVDRMVNALIIDRGSRDGVKKYMAVVTEQGLVGRVFEVNPTASSVQILRDTNSRVSAIIEGDKPVWGIVRWEGGSNLRMYLLEQQSIFTPGQSVYTTGVGGTYPEGLLIGEIIGKPENVGRVYDTVEIKPAADFTRAHEVFILKGSELSEIWDDGEGSGYFQRPDIQ